MGFGSRKSIKNALLAGVLPLTRWASLHAPPDLLSGFEKRKGLGKGEEKRAMKGKWREKGRGRNGKREARKGGKEGKVKPLQNKNSGYGLVQNTYWSIIVF